MSERIPREIPLTKGYVTLVDEEDFERVSQFKWYAHLSPHAVYARCSRKRNETHIWLHRFLLGVDTQVDHKDRNGLNNQKDNLRPVTNAENQAGRVRNFHRRSSRFKGVVLFRGDKWQAAITKYQKRNYLGLYREDFDAAQAYNLAAELYFGEFARFNTPWD